MSRDSDGKKSGRTLAHPKRQELIRRGHSLQARLAVGRQGLSPQFVTQADQTMRGCDLLKIRIEAESGEQASELAQELARKIGAQLVQRVGRVALLYRALREGSDT